MNPVSEDPGTVQFLSVTTRLCSPQRCGGSVGRADGNRSSHKPSTIPPETRTFPLLNIVIVVLATADDIRAGLKTEAVL